MKGQNDPAALVSPSPKLFVAQTNVYTTISITHALQIYIYIIITYIDTKFIEMIYQGWGT